ncbi:RHS repeat-associated core domain-containing protein [Cupriavidus sp. WS]|uniref:RHS repeat-associated core domain-containing protein n=1 Tax=Cupriavidus sp. WS TaxID=1312922 RepID=UPI00036D35C0|nr:RHS repeat-associated core domain-containing protein [Cupriavidus sp. WS]
MSGIGGLGGVLAGLEGVVLESLEVAPPAGRFRHQPGDLAGRYGARRALSGLLCETVDMTTGAKICLPWNEADFALPGRLPITWNRFYSSLLPGGGLLGPGWRSPWEVTLARVHDRLVYTDEQGRALSVPAPARGAQVIVSAEQLHIACLPDGRMVVADLTPRYRVFGDFDARGVARLKYVEDIHQHRIGCIWDEAGRLLRMRGTCGHELRLHYAQASSRLTGIECVDGGAAGFLARYGYDAHGQLAEVRNRLGDVVRRFAYAGGRMVEETGPLGHVTRYVWQPVGGAQRVAERITSDGAHERCTYRIENRTSQAVDVFGHAAHWQYDTHGRVRAHVGFDGRRHVFEYNGAGWPVMLGLPGERRLRAVYDNLGRVTQEIDPLGAECSRVYAFATGKLVSIRHDDGRTWLWQRNDRLQAVRRQSPRHGITQIRHEEQDGGLSEHRTDEQGQATVLEYDARGQLTRRVEPGGRATAYGRDAAGHVVSVIDAQGALTRIEPDLLGRPLVVTLPDGREERHAWNAAGQPVSWTGADGQTRHWHRDARGNVVRAVDEEGHVTLHEYDAHGRRTRTAGSNGAIQQLAWDPAGRLQSVTDADGVRREFAYAAAGTLGQVTATAGALARTETFDHDALGRLVSRETQHARYRFIYTRRGLPEAVGYEPTEAGRALGLEPDTIRFEYDALGRMTAEHGANGTLTYLYDAAGRATEVTLPHGQTVKTEHDEAGAPALLGLGSGQDMHGIAAFQHDAMRRCVLRSQGALYLHTHYTETGWPLRWFAMTAVPGENGEMAPGEVLQWRELQYSTAGNLARLDDRYDGRIHFDYDRRGALLRCVSDDLGIEYFTWDGAGNLLDTPRAGWQPAIYADHRLLECRGYRYEFDAWGQVTGKHGAAGALSLEWDAEGRLVAARQRDRVVRYRYDALGRCIRRSAGPAEPGLAGLQGLPGLPGSLFGGAQDEATQLVWQGGRLAQERTGDSIRTYLYQPAADGLTAYAPLACVDQKRLEDGTLGPMRVLHYHTDGAGTAVALTDESGEPVWRGRYKAWGGLAPSTGLREQARQPLRFAGQYADEETGLHLNGARFYDPDAGRYLSPDRTAPAGASPYRYVFNPLTGGNPDGHAVQMARMQPCAPALRMSGLDRLLYPSQLLTGIVEQFDDVAGGKLPEPGGED